MFLRPPAGDQRAAAARRQAERGLCGGAGARIERPGGASTADQPLQLQHSQHAWGQYCPRPTGAKEIRFTPTGVGTAVARDAATYSQTVHPHRRGDGALAVEAIVLERGSPPQAWGRRQMTDERPPECRFTPTGVGTARAMLRPWRIGPVHPHRRGDGIGNGRKKRKNAGSPPQAWGRRAIAPRGAR